MFARENPHDESPAAFVAEPAAIHRTAQKATIENNSSIAAERLSFMVGP
jgi:hypothetical protein